MTQASSIAQIVLEVLTLPYVDHCTYLSMSVFDLISNRHQCWIWYRSCVLTPYKLLYQAFCFKEEWVCTDWTSHFLRLVPRERPWFQIRTLCAIDQLMSFQYWYCSLPNSILLRSYGLSKIDIQVKTCSWRLPMIVTRYGIRRKQGSKKMRYKRHRLVLSMVLWDLVAKGHCSRCSHCSHCSMGLLYHRDSKECLRGVICRRSL